MSSSFFLSVALTTKAVDIFKFRRQVKKVEIFQDLIDTFTTLQSNINTDGFTGPKMLLQSKIEVLYAASKNLKDYANLHRPLK